MKNEHLDSVLKDAIINSKKEIPLKLKIQMESIPKMYSHKNRYAFIFHTAGIISIIIFFIFYIKFAEILFSGLFEYFSQLHYNYSTLYIVQSGLLYSILYILLAITLTWFFSFRKKHIHTY